MYHNHSAFLLVMFETLVTRLLTSALGNYIEPKCFSSDKINVAVWSGYVVLKELELKPDLLAELPAFKLVRGLVGSVELKIPWNRLQSESLLATVDDVYLLLRTEEDIDAAMRQIDEFTVKKKLLEQLYLQAKHQEQVANEASTRESNDGYAARLINKIIDNLELHIRRIHIRVEDHSAGDHSFALGLTIESVHVQSTNSNWQPSFVNTFKSNEPRIFKNVELNHMSVYCNPDCTLQRENQADLEQCTVEEFCTAFNRAIPKRFDDRHHHHMQLYPTQQQHHFILKPIDANTRLIINRDVLDATMPKFEIDVNISEVALRLEESQYCDLLYLASAIQSLNSYIKHQRYRKFRPQVAVLSEPLEWWNYAIDSVMRDIKMKRRQWTWDYIKERREDRKRYIKLWHHKSRQLLELLNVDYTFYDSDDNDVDTSEHGSATNNDVSSFTYSNLSELSTLEIDRELEVIERRWSVEDLLLFRYLADIEARTFQASSATRVRRRLPTPPMHKSQEFSETDSLETDAAESNGPVEVQYRSWGAWVFGWTSKLATSVADEESRQRAHQIIPEVELRELYKILEEPSRRSKKRVHKHHDLGGQDEFSDSFSSTELSQLYRVTVTLHRGSLALASDPETNRMLIRDNRNYGQKYAPTDFLLGTFSQLQVAAVAKAETVTIDMSLQSIEAYDECAESATFSRLLCRKPSMYPSGDGDDVNVSKLSGAVFLMSFEINPANYSAGASLFVYMEPLEIIWSPTARCWDRLGIFMDTPANLGLWEELEVASFNSIVNLKSRTEAKLNYVMENRIAVVVDLRIQAPVIVIPENDTDFYCARLVVDLGRITFCTDRLRQSDKQRMGMNWTSRPFPSETAEASSIKLQPNTNTSFVEQMYDETEKGEDTFRWKEGFYDRFSLSVANIHVMLIPYVHKNYRQKHGAGFNGSSKFSASLPAYIADVYNEEQEYELVERFNINVIIRMSTLSLDATLTRFYIHADLPALTFNLSHEKYRQLVALADRFSLANANALKYSRKSENGDNYPAEVAFADVDCVQNMTDDGLRKENPFSMSALNRFFLNSSETAPQTVQGASSNVVEGSNIAEDFDEDSSAESDDSWFSITNGNQDHGNMQLSNDGDQQGPRLTVSDLIDTTTAESGIDSISSRKSNIRKRPRMYASNGYLNRLDRKLVVCSFTIPVIAVQLKKPRISTVPSQASYRYDASEFSEDHFKEGTIIVKLQGLRIRIGQKTLSTQMNVSLVSLEVVDLSDAGDRSKQYLMFSCPTIAAPFSRKTPTARCGESYIYRFQSKVPARQQEQIAYFNSGNRKSSDGSGTRVLAAPAKLLELGYCSINDQESGYEVLREVKIHIGTVQFVFDQSYVCSLLELLEKSSSELSSIASMRDCGDSSVLIADTDDGLPPPLELTPSIKHEYSLPLILTESVRADLERARKSMFGQAPGEVDSSTLGNKTRMHPVALKLDVRLHSVSICFCDREESLASVALLNSQICVGTDTNGKINVSGSLGDLKVFGLSSKENTIAHNVIGTSGRKFDDQHFDYVDVFGLDTSAMFSKDNAYILSVKCHFFAKNDTKTTSTVKSEKQAKSSLCLSLQPVRLLAQPEFLRNMSDYFVNGPLRAHCLVKRIDSSETSVELHQDMSASLHSDYQRSSSEKLPESSTPYFDAVEMPNMKARKLDSETSSSPAYSRCIGGGGNHNIPSDAKNIPTNLDENILIFVRILDSFDVDITLCHPSIILPANCLQRKKISLQCQPSRGILLDFGKINLILRREEPNAILKALSCAPYQVDLAIGNLQIVSLTDSIVLLERSGVHMQCRIPALAVNIDLRNEKNNRTSAEIVLDLKIKPVCFNVSDTTVCLAHEVLYKCINPVVEIGREVQQRIKTYKGPLVIDSNCLIDSSYEEKDEVDAPFPATVDKMAKWDRVTIHFFLEEVKVALASNSKAIQQLETMMNSVLDNSDEKSSRESHSGAINVQTDPDQSNFSPDNGFDCVIGELALIALEANINLNLSESLIDDSKHNLQCNFSLQEAIVRDRIADSNKHVTQLVGLVPGKALERSNTCSELQSLSTSEENAQSGLFYSAQDSSALQLRGHFQSKRGGTNGTESVLTMNSLELSITSVRLILLPRTLLRLEHFVLDVYLAVFKNERELKLQQVEQLATRCLRDERTNLVNSDTEGDRTDERFAIYSLRKNESSISSIGDFVVGHSAVMSPLQRIGAATAIDDRVTDGAMSRDTADNFENAQPVASDTYLTLKRKSDCRKQLVFPQWTIDARMLNMQIWIVSTDRKADMCGCMLSADLVAKYNSTLDEAKSSTFVNRSDSVTASVELSKVKVMVASSDTSNIDQQILFRSMQTLVEDFELDIHFELRECFRPLIMVTDNAGGTGDVSSLNSRELDVHDERMARGEEKSKAESVINAISVAKNDDTKVKLPEIFFREVPSEWREWIFCESFVRLDQIISHVAYRDLPLLLKIFASLNSFACAEENTRSSFFARREAAAKSDLPNISETSGKFLEYEDNVGGSELRITQIDGQENVAAVHYDLHLRTLMKGAQFRLINNIADQASPVFEFELADINFSVRAKSNLMLEAAGSCKAEAMYQNLRLVTMEPLLEPWSVMATLSHTHFRHLDENKQAKVSPWILNVSSDVFLQFNMTDALIANLVAAERAWQWIANASDGSREMAEFSTYWIRNNTGMHLRYRRASSNEQYLAPGEEKALSFNKVLADGDTRHKNDMRRRDASFRSRHLYIAVEEESTDHNLSTVLRKWQSRAPIPVDQVDSRLYALEDFEADITGYHPRKCECIIDVLVERGCKYFIVRSTLVLENQTSSDLEVEFFSYRSNSISRTLNEKEAEYESQVPMISVWKKIVKASSIVPIPVHIASSGEGYVMVRPPEINVSVTEGDPFSNMPPKAYAKERVPLPLFDRSSASARTELRDTDDYGQAQCTIKFQRLYSDRPVRPFMINSCLTSASSTSYYRTLSFHPPLIVHNLTAGSLDFCMATPCDWSPATNSESLSNVGKIGWEVSEQRLRERGTINVADSLIWHLSGEETPLELSIRMKGYNWSEMLQLSKDTGELVQIKMKDLVSDAHLYITAEIRISKGPCREIFLHVPYWIVNLTGLKLEFEFEKERMGREHSTSLLAGQKRLDRDELLLQEGHGARSARRHRNPHLLYPISIDGNELTDENLNYAQPCVSPVPTVSFDRRVSEHKRRHLQLLPSIPPLKGLLDLLPKRDNTDPRSLGQLEVLQVCHSNYNRNRGCIRLRVSNDKDLAALDLRKKNEQRKWSNSFLLDQAGTIGEIEAVDFEANRKYCIGYSITPASGQYSRTKVIMLTPRFILVNTMTYAVEVCHSSSKVMAPMKNDILHANSAMPDPRAMSSVNSVVHLEAGGFADFHWTLQFSKTRKMRCRFTEIGWSWSGAVPLVDSGEYVVRLRHETTRESRLVRVILKLDSPSVCVYFREERMAMPPYRVENYSLETLRTHQHRVRRSEVLLPHHSLDYAWDEPTEEQLLVVDILPSAAGDNSRPLRIGSFNLDKIQRHPDALGGTLGIEIATDGPTRVLRFTDTRLRGQRYVQTNTQISSKEVPKSDGNALQFLGKFVVNPTVQAALHLKGIGISIVDSTPKELIYISASGIALEVFFSKSDVHNNEASIAGSAASSSQLERETRPQIVACCLEVNDIQVDNQLQRTLYPVLLRFSKSTGSSQIVNGHAVVIPVLQMGLVKHDEYAGINFIRHFSVSVLPVHIRVDGALLYQILPLLMHSKIYRSTSINVATTKKKLTDYGDSNNVKVTRAAHSQILLKALNESLEIPVKVLDAAQKEGIIFSEQTTAMTTPTKATFLGNSYQRQIQNQHALVDNDIQRYSPAIVGNFEAISAKDEQMKLYFEEFQIDPIRATVSFSFGDGVNAITESHLSPLPSYAAALNDSSSSQESSVITVGPLRLILNAIGTSLTKIANAPFHLKPLHIHNTFVQPDALAMRLVSHYQSEALRQAYVILGSVDVLGNPMIAWKNMRNGFQDLISEPAHGLSQRSPKAFAYGVGRGSLSLLRGSVYTFLDFNTRILTAFSLGLSEACLKLDDYTGYPATRHIFQGIVQGISGVVVAPIHSFEVNGARGVLPGLIAGALGVMLKPLLGLSLATATTAATLRDAIDPYTKALLVRVRPPRYIDLRTKRLKIYSYVESLGEEIVGKVCGGCYRSDGYLGHVDLKATHQCFLVTRKRILLLSVRGTPMAQTTKYDVLWELLAEEIVLVDCTRTLTDQVVNIYYIEDDFLTASGARKNSSATTGSHTVAMNCRRTPSRPRGMILQKHVVVLPVTKVLFVRAMLQQQDRSFLTKMNIVTTEKSTSHQINPLSSLARSNSMEMSTRWPQHSCIPLRYPVFRLPAQTMSVHKPDHHDNEISA